MSSGGVSLLLAALKRDNSTSPSTPKNICRRWRRLWRRLSTTIRGGFARSPSTCHASTTEALAACRDAATKGAVRDGSFGASCRVCQASANRRSRSIPSDHAHCRQPPRNSDQICPLPGVWLTRGQVRPRGRRSTRLARAQKRGVGHKTRRRRERRHVYHHLHRLQLYVAERRGTC